MANIESVGDCGEIIAQAFRSVELESDGVPLPSSHPKITEVRAHAIAGETRTFAFVRGTGYENYSDDFGYIHCVQPPALNPFERNGVVCVTEQFGIGIYDRQMETIQGAGRLGVGGAHGLIVMEGDLEPIEINPQSTECSDDLQMMSEEIVAGRSLNDAELRDNYHRLIPLAYFFRDPAEDQVPV